MLKVGEIHIFTYPNMKDFVGICLDIDGLNVTLAGVNQQFIFDEFNFNKLYCKDIELSYDLKSYFRKIQSLYNDLIILQDELIKLSNRKLLLYKDNKLNLTNDKINSKIQNINDVGNKLLINYLKFKEDEYGKILNSKNLAPLDVKRFILRNDIEQKEFVGVCVSSHTMKDMIGASYRFPEEFLILDIENNTLVLKEYQEGDLLIKPVRFKTDGLRDSFIKVAKLYQLDLKIQTGKINKNELFQYSIDDYAYHLKNDKEELISLYNQEYLSERK